MQKLPESHRNPVIKHISSSYLYTQVVVTAPWFCSGVHFAQRKHLATRETIPKFNKSRVSKLQVKDFCNPHCECSKSLLWYQWVRHHFSPLSLSFSLCCGVCSWSRLNFRAWERQCAGFPVTHPPFLQHNLPRPAACFSNEAPSSWTNAHSCNFKLIIHKKKDEEKKKKDTYTLPDPHTPTAVSPSTPPSRHQTLTNSSLPSLTLYTPTSTSSPLPLLPTMVSLCPDNTNGLGFQLILLLFKRKKKGRHQHRIGWLRSLITMAFLLNIVRGLPYPLTDSQTNDIWRHPPATEARYNFFIMTLKMFWIIKIGFTWFHNEELWQALQNIPLFDTQASEVSIFLQEECNKMTCLLAVNGSSFPFFPKHRKSLFGGTTCSVRIHTLCEKDHIRSVCANREGSDDG